MDNRLPPGIGTVALGLMCCGVGGTFDCDRCPYWNRSRQSLSVCRTILHEEALGVIRTMAGMELLVEAPRVDVTPQSPLQPQPKPKKKAKRVKRTPEQEKDLAKVYKLQRRERLKAAGLCQCCGKAPAIEGITKCVACKEKERLYLKKWREKKKGEINEQGDRATAPGGD